MQANQRVIDCFVLLLEKTLEHLLTDESPVVVCCASAGVRLPQGSGSPGSCLPCILPITKH
eukprot:1161934-Pelagomonas_calceolata.AAC.6